MSCLSEMVSTKRSRYDPGMRRVRLDKMKMKNSGSDETNLVSTCGRRALPCLRVTCGKE
jgi:hypothetical protein